MTEPSIKVGDDIEVDDEQNAFNKRNGLPRYKVQEVLAILKPGEVPADYGFHGAHYGYLNYGAKRNAQKVYPMTDSTPLVERRAVIERMARAYQNANPSGCVSYDAIEAALDASATNRTGRIGRPLHHQSTG